MNKVKYIKESYHLDDGFYWDIIYSSRHGLYYTKRVQNFINKFQKPHIKTVLEIGCGTGRFTIPICKKGYNIVGLDFDRFPLLIMQKRDADVESIQGNATDLPFIDESFDLIISIGVIKYIECFDCFVDECHRVLKKDGLLVIETTNKNNFRIIIKKLLHKRITNYYTPFSYKNLNKFMKKGFKIIGREGFNWIPFNSNSNNKLIDFFDYAEKFLKLDRLPFLAPEYLICAKKIEKNHREFT